MKVLVGSSRIPCWVLASDYPSFLASQTSLVYASRVKTITNNASKNAEKEEVTKLKKIIANLKAGGTGVIPGMEDDVDLAEEPEVLDEAADDGAHRDDGEVDADGNPYSTEDGPAGAGTGIEDA